MQIPTPQTPFDCADPADLLARQWRIHGAALEFQTDHPLIEALFADLLRGFAPILPPLPDPAIRIQMLSDQRWDIPASATILPPSSNEIVNTLASYNLKTTFAREGTLNYYEIAPMGGAVYDIGRGVACGYVQNVEDYPAWRIGHLLLLIVLLEMLRGQEMFWIHAGSVAYEGKGALIIGHTGSGKTTTVLNLAHSGFEFLSEDRTLIKRTPSGITLLGMPLDLAVTPNTVNLLAWLSEHASTPTGRGKIHLNPLDVFGGSLTDQAAAKIILYPTVTHADTTCLIRLDPAQSLMRLLPNSLLASNPAITQQHFAVMGDLVHASQSYRLELGTDFERVPDLIRDLLA